MGRGRARIFTAFWLLGVVSPAMAVPPTWPAVREVWHDDFEASGLSSIWEDVGKGHVSLSTSAAQPPSDRGLAVDVSGTDQYYLQRYNLTDPPDFLQFPRDTYLRFAFHPNGVSIPSGKTLALVRMRDTDWKLMAGLRLKQENSGYSVVLELPDGTLDTVSLPVANQWQTLVLGVRPHDWVGAWAGGQQRVVSGVTHAAGVVRALLFGKADGSWSGGTPSGTIFFDDATLMFAAYPELWVDASAGHDTNEGNTSGTPLQTLGMAAKLTSAGTVVHIAPGTYRESLVQPVDGAEGKPIRYLSTGGRGQVRIRGSNPASSATWTRLTTNEIGLPSKVDLATATIWKADLSSWNLTGVPVFVALPGGKGGFTRLPWAREPDFKVVTPWKYHEFWWAADGGVRATTCDPTAVADCDAPDRSDRELTDTHDDTGPSGIEAGSLASLGDVTGAIIHVKDTYSGHYTYVRRVQEMRGAGHLVVKRLADDQLDECRFDGNASMPALGWNSKYFVEGLAKFLDTPGEWYFDQTTQTIYIWTPDGRSPDQLGVEISAREYGVDLSHHSYVELVDLDIALCDRDAIHLSNYSTDRSYGITLRGLDVGWATNGLVLGQNPGSDSPIGSQIRHFTLRDSIVHDIDNLALYSWPGGGTTWIRPGVTDLLIVHNEFARVGFYTGQGGVGLDFSRADHLLFQGNHVHDIAHNGVEISSSQTAPGNRGYALAPEEIYSGDILVRGNLFENCVQNGADAGGLKFWGKTATRSHLFRDVLVTGNVSRNNIGWTWVFEKRNSWGYQGRGGIGYYIDYAGGIHFFRNLAYQNGLEAFSASGAWIDQGAVLANNTFVNHPYGGGLGVGGACSSSNQGFYAVNNLLIHIKRFAWEVGQEAAVHGNAHIDANLYHLLGYEPWQSFHLGILAGHVDGTGWRQFPELTDVQALGWEANGKVGDPHFADFDPSITDGSWQDFRLTSASTLAIDTGIALPQSLVTLLEKFHLEAGQKGAALDRGAIEFDPSNPTAPYVIEVGPTSGSGTVIAPWDGEPPAPDVPPVTAKGGCGCGAGSYANAGWMVLLGFGWFLRLRRARRRIIPPIIGCCAILAVASSGCSTNSTTGGENFHCEPETGYGPLTISVSTSRASGVAPLSVFFDATGTTGLTNNCFFSDNAAYMDATFSWNFDADDVDAGANYKTASGFLVAHVFENPGSYRVHLDVYDAAGKTASRDITITVTAFSGTTYYVSADGSDSNNGLSMDRPFSTPEHALSSSILGPNVRVLFKNGNTFTISNMIAVSDEAGPIIIGAYSDPSDPSSDKPIIHTTAANSDWATIYFWNCSDIRIMDIAARAGAESSENPRYPYGMGWGYDCAHMLKYRTEEYQNGGMSLSPCGQYTTVAECAFHDTTNTGYTSNTEGVNDGNAIIGNLVYKKSNIDTDNEEHVFRLQGGSRYFIAHNIFGPNVKVNYDALTIRGNSEKIVIYKNKITGWVQDITPQNKNSAREYQHHCMVDSNLIVGQGSYDGDRQQALGARAKDIVYRNNIIYDYQFGLGIGNDTVVGYSRRIKVYNNTFINPRPNDYFNPIFLDAVCTGIEIENNLMLDVGGGDPSHLSFLDIRDGSALNGKSDYNIFYGSGWNADPNLFDGSNIANWRSSTGNDQHSSIANPRLLSTDHDDADFCKPRAGSPVIDAGAFTPNALDFNGSLRDGLRDIGACEYL